MPPLRVESTTDPRLDVFRQLKQTNLTRWSGRFIAEGKLVVERLLASRYDVESLLLSERRLALLEEFAVPDATPVYVIAEEQARELTGFNFHAGVMACGLRGSELDVDDLCASLPPPTDGSAPRGSLFVACPRMTDPDNLGSLIRLCRGFGVGALLLGHGCCDPFSRRTLRVSMGNAFELPVIESPQLQTDLLGLRDRYGFQLSATVLDGAALPLESVRRQPREILLLGNEADGLSEDWISLCDRQLTIPMSAGVDSLNVSVAAGIFLHWLQRSG